MFFENSTSSWLSVGFAATSVTGLIFSIIIAWMTYRKNFSKKKADEEICQRIVQTSNSDFHKRIKAKIKRIIACDKAKLTKSQLHQLLSELTIDVDTITFQELATIPNEKLFSFTEVINIVTNQITELKKEVTNSFLVHNEGGYINIVQLRQIFIELKWSIKESKFREACINQQITRDDAEINMKFMFQLVDFYLELKQL